MKTRATTRSRKGLWKQETRSDFRLIAIRDFDNNGTLDLLGSRTIARDRYTLSIIWDNGKGDETPFTGKMGDIDSFTR